jgi:hypothetical protein
VTVTNDPRIPQARSLMRDPDKAFEDEAHKLRVREAAQAIDAARSRAGKPWNPNLDGNPYASGQHSYFRDLIALHDARAREQAAISDPVLRGRDPGTALPADDARAVRGRLAWLEKRDLTTTAGAGGQFVPQNAPSDVAESFATAARTKGVMPGVLGVLPLDPEGLTVRVPRFSSGATVATQRRPRNGL